MRLEYQDIAGKVDEGIDGIQDVLTAINDFKVHQYNVNHDAAISPSRYSATGEDVLVWSLNLVVATGEPHTIIQAALAVPEYISAGRLVVAKLRATAQDNSVVAGLPSVRLYLNGAIINNVSTIAVSAPVVDAVGSTEIQPGDILSISCDTTAGADAYDSVNVVVTLAAEFQE